MTTTRNTPMPVSTAIAVLNADGQYAYLNRVDGLYWFYTTAIGKPTEPWAGPKALPGVIAWKLKEVRNYARDLVNAGRVVLDENEKIVAGGKWRIDHAPKS